MANLPYNRRMLCFKNACTFFLTSIVLLTAACTPIERSEQPSTTVLPTITSSAVLEPTATAASTDTPVPTATATTAVVTSTRPPTPLPPTAVATPQETAGSYISESGRFTIMVPDRTAVYENVQPSVDGVFVDVPDSIALIRSNYVISVRWLPAATQTLTEFIDAQTQCVMINGEEGETIMVNGVEARRFLNVPCGPTSTTFTYLLNEDLGYIIVVRYNVPYQNIAEPVEAVIDSLTIR